MTGTKVDDLHSDEAIDTSAGARKDDLDDTVGEKADVLERRLIVCLFERRRSDCDCETILLLLLLLQLLLLHEMHA
jgi:hypothetical protein